MWNSSVVMGPSVARSVTRRDDARGRRPAVRACTGTPAARFRLRQVDATLADPLLGQLLDGRYRVDRRIARGGMATVYAALDTRLDRRVAVKVMHPALADDEEVVPPFLREGGGLAPRFTREAKAAARLSPPNVVAVYDQGEDAGRVFLVMEYVAGRT